MPKKSIIFAAQLLWLVAACGSGGLDSHRIQVPASLIFTKQPTAAIAGVAMRPAFVVKVLDERGSPVTSARTRITLAIGNNPGTGTLSGTVTAEAVNGVAIFSDLRLDTSGTGYTLVAEATGLSGATSDPFKVTLGPAKLVFLVQPSPTALAEAIGPPVKVRVVDLQGNTVEAAAISVSLAIETNPTGATLGGTPTVVVDGGVAIFSNVRIDKPGTGYTLSASASGVDSVTSDPFTVGGFLAFSMQPTAVIAGVAMRPAVAVNVLDHHGKTVTSARTSVTLALGNNPAGGTLSGTVTAEAVDGVALFSELSLDRPGTGYILTANAAGLGGASSIAFNVTRAKLAFTGQPTAAIAGAAIRPAVAVTVQDEHGNTVPAAHPTVKVALGSNSAGGILSGTVTAEAVNGVAVFPDLSLDRSGTGYTLTANAEGVSEGGSNPFNVSYPPATLAFGVQPRKAGAGHPIAPAVTVAVLDREGNTVETASTRVTMGIGINPSGATLAGTPTAAVVNGVASFPNLIIDKAGTGYTLDASASGLDDASSAPFDVRSGFDSVSAGGGHTCAVATWGPVYCWGSDFWNQLGSGWSGAVEVAGGLTFAAVSAGSAHTCGLTISGAAYCWGANWSGQLGNGSTTDSGDPVPVAGGLTFVVLSAGVNATCGVTTSGAAYCWGSNWSGALGNGSGSDSSVPVPVSGGLSFVYVSTGGIGGEYSCGVTTSGRAYCWGANYSGQLGNNSTSDTTEPVEVAGALTFVTVSVGGAWVYAESVGYAHACGVTTSGAAYCWGANHRGQLGDASTTGSLTPIPVAGGLTFKMLSSRGWASCGVTTSGAGYCWGSNDSGELGNGSTSHSSTPVPVAGGLKFATVDGAPADGQFGEFTAPAHTCGVSSEGAVYCWGSTWEGYSLFPVRLAP